MKQLLFILLLLPFTISSQTYNVTLPKVVDTIYIPIIADTIKENGEYYVDTKGLLNPTTFLHIRVKINVVIPQDTVFIRPKGFKKL